MSVEGLGMVEGEGRGPEAIQSAPVAPVPGPDPGPGPGLGLSHDLGHVLHHTRRIRDIAGVEVALGLEVAADEATVVMIFEIADRDLLDECSISFYTHISYSGDYVVTSQYILKCRYDILVPRSLVTSYRVIILRQERSARNVSLVN